MIVSFKHRGLQKLFEENNPKKLPPDMVERIAVILSRLYKAEFIDALNVHSYRLHALKGARKGIWSITVRANWRITFRFKEGHVHDVNFEDYH